MQKIRKWWLPLLLVILLIAAAAVVFWDGIVMFIAPKPVLTAAITEAMSKLEERSQGSPIWILAKGYDEGGKNTTFLDLKTFDSILGEINYDMMVQTDLSDHQVSAEGMVSSGGNSLNLSVYLDREFAALTSEDLLKGGYYGITYETFADDIRSFPLLTFLIPTGTIASWESSVSSLQEYMNRTYQLPQIPEITEEDIQMLMLGILALKSRVTTEEIQVYGQALDCHKLTYSAAGTQVGEALGYLMNSDSLEDGEITASFYLYEKTLVKLELSGRAGDDSVRYDLTLGQDTATDDLSLVAIKDENGERTQVSLLVSTKQAGDQYVETICVNDIAVSYDWNTVSGDMTLNLPGKEAISLNLADAENGFRITTKDIAKILDIDSKSAYDCKMTVSKGAEITTPNYKNMDKWSMDDFLILLTGVGSLIGVNAK